MKNNFKNILITICLFLLILNLGVNTFLLANQLYQGDSTTYTIIKFIIIIILSYIFYKYLLRKDLKNRFYFVQTYIIILIILFVQSLFIYENNKIVVIGKLDCNNTRQSLFYYKDYRYYSSCNFSNINIKIGNEVFSFYEVVHLREDKKQFLINRFKLEAEDERKKFNIKLSNTAQVIFVKTLLETNYYYYGIESIEVLYNEKIYNLKDLDYPFSVEKFLSLKKIDENYNALYEGKYYNMVACFRSYRQLIDGYIIPSSMKIDDTKEFCYNVKK